MKIIIFNILIGLLYFSSLNAQKINSSMLSGNYIFPISEAVEPDSGYNKVLGKYIVTTMKDNNVEGMDADSLSGLYKRKSFSKVILNLCDSNNYSSSNFLFEDNSRWVETLPNLISNCKNVKVKYLITDSLLKRDSDIGLVAMWNHCDLGKLKYYNQFKDNQIAKKRTFQIAYLVIICKNSRNTKECQYLMRYLKNLDKNETDTKIFKYLSAAIKQKNSITFYDFISSFNDYLLDGNLCFDN